MSSRVRVRPTYVAEEEILRSELSLEPRDVDDGSELRHGR
jgi:hypothetical protein